MRPPNIILLIALLFSIRVEGQDTTLLDDCNCSAFFVEDGFTYCDSAMTKKVNGVFQCELNAKDGIYWTEYNYLNGVRTGEYKSTRQQNIWPEKASGEFLHEATFHDIIKSKCKAILVEFNFQYFYRTIEVVAYNPGIELDQNTIDFLVQNVFQPLKEKYNCDQIVFALNINGFYDQLLNYDEYYKK